MNDTWRFVITILLVLALGAVLPLVADAQNTITPAARTRVASSFAAYAKQCAPISGIEALRVLAAVDIPKNCYPAFSASHPGVNAGQPAKPSTLEKRKRPA